MKTKAYLSRFVIALFIISACVCQSYAQTDVQIHVVNLPVEFDGELLALAGTVNGWDNSISTSVVANDSIGLTFYDVDTMPLDGGWLSTPP